MPPPLPGEDRAPDSIQFNLIDVSDAECDAFVKAAVDAGVKVQIFGRSTDNARAFWNWQFIDDVPELPHTRAMLKRACDVRLPVQLTRDDLDKVTDALLAAIGSAKPRKRAAVA